MSAIFRFTARSSLFTNAGKGRSFTTAAVSTANESQHQFPQFSNAAELLQYADAQVQTMDPMTLAKFVKYSAVLLHRLPDGRDARVSPSMKKVVTAAVQLAFNSQDVHLASRLFRSVADHAPFPGNMMPQHLKDAGNSLLQSVVSHKLNLTAESCANVLSALIKLDAKDLALCNFVKEEIPKHVSEMTPGSCRTVFRALYDLGLRDVELNRMLMDKMLEHIDQFRNSDVIGSLATFAHTSYICSPIMKRCNELLSQHTSLFDAVELLTAAESLIQLQQFPFRIAQAMVEEIQKRVRTLHVPELGRLLAVLTNSPGSDAQFANEIVGILASSPSAKSPIVSVNMAYAICCFNIQERKALLQTLINDLLQFDTYKRPLLTKLLEIVESAKHDMDVKVDVPARFYAQVEELYANQKTSGYAYMVKELMEKLPEKYRLSVESGVRVGAFLPTFVDTKNKVVVEVANGSEFVGIRLRKNLYAKLGYSTAQIKSRVLRPLKSEEAKVEYIETALGPAMVNLGRMTSEELNNRRDAMRAARA